MNNDKSNSEIFLEQLSSNYGIKANYTIFSTEWPLLELYLNDKQFNIFSRVENIDGLIVKCEIEATDIHRVNTIMGSTKINVQGNTVYIKGSQTVMEILIQNIFN